MLRTGVVKQALDGGAQSTRRAPSVLLVPSTQHCRPAQCRRHCAVCYALVWAKTSLTYRAFSRSCSAARWASGLDSPPSAGHTRIFSEKLPWSTQRRSWYAVTPPGAAGSGLGALVPCTDAVAVCPPHGARAERTHRRASVATRAGTEVWRTSIVVGRACYPVQRRHGLASLRWAAHASAMDYGG